MSRRITALRDVSPDFGLPPEFRSGQTRKTPTSPWTISNGDNISLGYFLKVASFDESSVYQPWMSFHALPFAWPLFVDTVACESIALAHSQLGAIVTHKS